MPRRTRRVLPILAGVVAVLLVAGAAVWFSLDNAPPAAGDPSATPTPQPTSTAYTLTPAAGGYRYRDPRFTAFVPSTWRITGHFYDYTIIRFDLGSHLFIDVGRVSADGDAISTAHTNSQSGRTGYRESAPPRPISGVSGGQSWSYSYTGDSGNTVWEEAAAKPVAGGYLTATLSTGHSAERLAKCRTKFYAFVASLNGA